MKMLLIVTQGPLHSVHWIDLISWLHFIKTEQQLMTNWYVQHDANIFLSCKLYLVT